MTFRIAPEGRPIYLFFLAVAIGLSFLSWIAAGVAALLFLFSLWFFRDPKERRAAAPGEILAPSYGTVVQVSEEEDPLYLKGKSTRVAIFLSVFDIHINYSPAQGKVEMLRYTPGKFHNAMGNKASLLNESNWIGIESKGKKILVRQIAGAIARRIVCHLRLGDNVTTGQRIGLIRFGSRVEVWLPPGTEVKVRPGEKMRGGLTVIGVQK